jgi:hypothetical protein
MVALGRIRMRMREARLWGIGAAALLLGAGCAASGSKPCMTIPAQIELARDVRDVAKGNLEDNQNELGRIKSNLEQSKLHMARLIEERDQLKKEVGGTPSGTTGGQGAQAPTPPAQGGKKQ